MKSSICFTKKPCSEAASAEEKPAEGTADPRLRMPLEAERLEILLVAEELTVEEESGVVTTEAAGATEDAVEDVGVFNPG